MKKTPRTRVNEGGDGAIKRVQSSPHMREQMGRRSEQEPTHTREQRGRRCDQERSEQSAYMREQRAAAFVRMSCAVCSRVRAQTRVSRDSLCLLKPAIGWRRLGLRYARAVARASVWRICCRGEQPVNAMSEWNCVCMGVACTRGAHAVLMHSHLHGTVTALSVPASLIKQLLPSSRLRM